VGLFVVVALYSGAERLGRTVQLVTATRGVRAAESDRRAATDGSADKLAQEELV